jgi:hypothetical protein
MELLVNIHTSNMNESVTRCLSQGCAVTDFTLRFTEISLKYQLKSQSPVTPLL